MAFPVARAGSRGVTVFVTTFCHFLDQGFMSQVESFELSPPAHGFGVMGIALFVIGNY